MDNSNALTLRQFHVLLVAVNILAFLCTIAHVWLLVGPAALAQKFFLYAVLLVPGMAVLWPLITSSDEKEEIRQFRGVPMFSGLLVCGALAVPLMLVGCTLYVFQVTGSYYNAFWAIIGLGFGTGRAIGTLIVTVHAEG